MGVHGAPRAAGRALIVVVGTLLQLFACSPSHGAKVCGPQDAKSCCLCAQAGEVVVDGGQLCRCGTLEGLEAPAWECFASSAGCPTGAPDLAASCGTTDDRCFYADAGSVTGRRCYQGSWVSLDQQTRCVTDAGVP